MTYFILLLMTLSITEYWFPILPDIHQLYCWLRKEIVLHIFVFKYNARITYHNWIDNDNMS